MLPRIGKRWREARRHRSADTLKGFFKGKQLALPLPLFPDHGHCCWMCVNAALAMLPVLRDFLVYEGHRSHKTLPPQASACPVLAAFLPAAVQSPGTFG